MLDQSEKENTASLCEEVCNAVLGMMNMCSCAKSQARNVAQKEDDAVIDSQRLPTVSDMPVASNGISHIRFRKLIVRRGSVSYTPHSNPLLMSRCQRSPVQRHQR